MSTSGNELSDRINSLCRLETSQKVIIPKKKYVYYRGKVSEVFPDIHARYSLDGDSVVIRIETRKISPKSKPSHISLSSIKGPNDKNIEYFTHYSISLAFHSGKRCIRTVVKFPEKL